MTSLLLSRWITSLVQIPLDLSSKSKALFTPLGRKMCRAPTPPASPANGDRYIVPAAATGVWAGKTNQIAVRIADAWEYHVPKIGWLCYIEDEAKLSAYKSTGWSAGLAI
ncbi:DUF2793 domain-containing protein [Massilia sp. TS11]|uniref:DUF2793 domain-containing protein n=1 Tax=Massilia sp. TS11 TaxID=2908003 RepID=UPI0035A39CE4